MKTPIQELIEEMEANSVAGEMFWIKQPNEFYKKYLAKEKEYIIDFHVMLMKNGLEQEGNVIEWDYNELKEEALEYYNQTYNQKIPELLYKDGTPMRKVKLGEEAQELLDEVHNEKRGDLVRLLRWVLKHYSTGTDIDGFFMWENPIGEEFDSIQVVDHYLKENK